MPSGWALLFGSTVVPPAADDKSGFQVGTRRYTWQFPPEMEIVTRTVLRMWDDPEVSDAAKYDASCASSESTRAGTASGLGALDGAGVGWTRVEYLAGAEFDGEQRFHSGGCVLVGHGLLSVRS